jgi:alpha-tubulin suppressor-like RCC1 family protein
MSEKLKFSTDVRVTLSREQTHELLDDTQLQISDILYDVLPKEQIHKVLNNAFPNEQIYVSGYNKYGQLDLGDKQDRNVLTQIQYTRVKEVSTGIRHMVMIDENNTMLICGCNENGQLALGDNKPTQISYLRVKQVSAGGIHTDDNIWVFGDNTHGQLGLEKCPHRNIPTKIPDLKALQVSAGSYHTVILDLNNEIWVCGNNENGQLGLGIDYYTYFIHKPTKIENMKAKQVNAGKLYTVMINLNDDIWVCGNNERGQLIFDNNEDINILTQIPNKFLWDCSTQ